MSEDTCVICHESNDLQTSKLGKKGCEGLLRASAHRGDSLTVVPGQVIHLECRRRYCHPNDIRPVGKHPDALSSPKTRQTFEEKFDFKSKCIFCGTDAKSNGNKRGIDVYPVRTFDFQTTIKSICAKRNDEWANTVLGRIEYACDLPAVEARYHHTCSSNFRSGCNVPKQYRSQTETNTRKVGRPTKVHVENAFLQVMEHFEMNETEQLTVSDLVSKMTELCGDAAYSTVYMKQRVLEHFDGRVHISEINGIHNVVTFKTKAAAILHSFFKQKGKEDTDSEKKRIIKTAAKLILRDIESIEAQEEYPCSTDINSHDFNMDYVPTSLQLFLLQLIDSTKKERKVASIGQAIIQASMPRKGIIAPLQLGLGVQMHHLFGSKYLIEILHSMGFCSSYQEVQRFEASAATSQGPGVDKTDHQFVQFVADNVDHNSCTLDGYNTFHGMGMIATVTPAVEHKRIVRRIETSNEDLVAIGKIDVTYYTQFENNMDQLVFKQLSEIVDGNDFDELDFLIKIARPLKVDSPGWSGIMQTVQHGHFPGKSSVLFLPMINMNPSDLSCIYSTLTFIVRQCQLNDSTPVITFDQPLYWKAINIVENEPDGSDVKSVVVRLGGFHTEMSFLGSIGRLMESSGLPELLQTIYAPDTVVHMLSGKAVNRSVRGHFLVYDALNTLLTERAFPHLQQSLDNEINRCDGDSENENVGNNYQQRQEVKELFENIISKEILPENLSNNDTLKGMQCTFENTKRSPEGCRTAQLWLQYMYTIEILKRFIASERTGNWNGHLCALQQMLPYFAATGHNLYLKSAYIYIQKMLDLANTDPDVYEAFCSGYHVIRRSDRYWAGLSSDLVIEQVLMRSVKSVGGMTRGRGMSDAQRARWLLSMPACAEMNSAMQEFTGKTYETSEQHKECSTARVERDNKDRDIVVQFLRERNPFTDEPSLRNIETGALAEKHVNVDKAKVVGQSILDDIENKKVLEYSFKRKKQVITQGTKNNLKIGGEDISVDPQLLFQRLITIADSTLDDTEQLFKHELSANPSSLFDSSGLLREAQKPLLANAIWELGKCGVDEISENVVFVLDGGSLLHRIPWAYGATFGEICLQYAALVEKKYGPAHVVFDGYVNGPSTKDVTHERRSKGARGTTIIFNENTPFKTKKELFLSNAKNKQCFIEMLGTYLTSRGCIVQHAADDADLLVTKTAVDLSCEQKVVVVGEDTDLLVLLCHHADLKKERVYFRSDTKAGLRKKKIWDITETRRLLGAEACSIIPFVHAVTGCDTTSRIYGIGKGMALKKALKDGEFRKNANVFLKDSTNAEIEEAGEKVIQLLYNSNVNSGLNVLRHRKFVQKVNTGSVVVQIQTLPPTQDAAKYHSYRTYHQVQTWMGKDLNPLDWGWCDNGDGLAPIKCVLAAAPERLLKILRCNCKLNCDSKKCSCRKHGLLCTTCCGECRGISCSNSQKVTDDVLEG